MSMEWLALLAVIMLGLITAVVVPTQLKLWRLLGKAESLVALMRQELLPLVSESRQAVQELRQVTGEAREGVQHAMVLARALEDVGHRVEEASSLVQRRGAALSVLAHGVWAGARAAFAALTGRDGNNGG